ncbi:MAG: hypothetical protein Tsb002_05160 [Wenzhouxiangellaceae bacterium]
MSAVKRLLRILLVGLTIWQAGVNITLAQTVSVDERAVMSAVFAENGQFDSTSYFAAMHAQAGQLVLPAADGQMIDSGGCDLSAASCAPSDSGADTSLPGVRNVQIKLRSPNPRHSYPNFSVHWQAPQPLPAGSSLELSHYEVFLSQDDETYTHYRVLPEIDDHGILRLPTRIRFRRQDIADYRVHVRAMYAPISTTGARSSNHNNGFKSVGMSTQNFGGESGSGWNGGTTRVNSNSRVDELNDAVLEQCAYNSGYTAATILSAITQLSCVQAGLTALGEIEFMSGLQSLDVSNQLDATDQPIATGANSFTDLAKLTDLDNLIVLNLSGNPQIVSSNIVTPVDSLDALSTLNLAACNYSSVPAFTHAGLATLDISHNNLTNLSAFNNTTFLSALRNLVADGNPLGNNIDLANRPALSVLSLRDVELSNDYDLNRLPDEIDFLHLDQQSNGGQLSLQRLLSTSPFGTPTHPGVHYQLTADGNTRMYCQNRQELEDWFWQGAGGGCSFPHPTTGCLSLPLLVESPDYCHPDQIENFHIRSTPQNSHEFSWDAVAGSWGVTHYEITAYSATNTALTTMQVNGSATNSLSANSFPETATQFTIRACVPQQCGDATPLTAPDVGLAPVTGLQISWVSQENGTFNLQWGYPQAIFDHPDGSGEPDYFLVEPALPASGQPAAYQISVSGFQQSWATNPTVVALDTDDNELSIYRLRACQLVNLTARCGPQRAISVVPSPVGLLSGMTPTNLQTSGTGTSFELAWTPVNDPNELVDYYKIIETNNNLSLAQQEFYSENNNIKLERRFNGTYSYSVAACRRDRANGDTCSGATQATDFIVNATNPPAPPTIPAKTWYFDPEPSVADEIRLRWQHFAEWPDYFEFELTLAQGVAPPQQNFIVYASNENNDAGFFVTPPELNMWRPAGSLNNQWHYNVRACRNGHICSAPVELLVSSQTELTTLQNEGPAGGPGAMNPGLWWNQLYAGTGWYFYWSSGLRYPSVHESYGNTYDLLAVWGSYQLINGNWSPVWLYAELKLSENGDYFSGAMYYPSIPQGSSTPVITQVADIEIHFGGASAGSGGPVDNNQARLVLKHLDVVGMPNVPELLELDISNFEVTGMCTTINANNCSFGETNPYDHLGGLWFNDSDSDGQFIDEDFIVMNWINRDLEGMMVGFYDTHGRPIYALAQSCRDIDEDGQIVSSECDRPGLERQDYVDTPAQNDRPNFYYSIKSGFLPTEPAPEGFNISDQVVALGQAIPGSPGGGREFNADFRTGKAWFNIEYNHENRVGRLDYGTREAPLPIIKGASFSDIRLFDANGDPATNCASGVACDINLTWFTDEYYPNAKVFYQRDGGLARNLDTLCSGATQPGGFVVELFGCLLDDPSTSNDTGTYVFYLTSGLSGGNGFVAEEIIAESAPLVVGNVSVMGLPEVVAVDPLSASESGLLHGVASHDPTIGAVTGAPGVSGGAATYSIPINVPPGRQGMQPSISLNYNSRGGNGVAGMGWSLSAGSSIHRCPMTVATDGQTIGVQYNQNDRLCLDGQRLIRVNSGDYWAQNGDYRTEIDSFVRVTMVNGVADSAVNARGETLSFQLEGKDNLTRLYGNSATTRVSPEPLTISQDAVTSSWLLARETDPAGNRVDYHYQTEGAGEHLLQTIRYTGDATSEGVRGISFYYEARSDRAESWQAGYRTEQSQRLQQIRTCIQVEGNDNQCVPGSANRVREYTLSYVNSSATQRSLLEYVRECAYDPLINANRCLDETFFDWNHTAVPKYDWVELDDSNGNPLIDASGFDIGGWQNNEELTPDLDILGDYNGDGQRELRLTLNGRPYLVGIDGDGNELGRLLLTGNFGAALTPGRYRGDQDFNDDGRSDFFFAKETFAGSGVYIFAFAQWRAGVTWASCATGCQIDDFFEVRDTNIPATTGSVPLIDDGPASFVYSDPAHIADFNGDGQKDVLIMQSGGDYTLWLNTEANTATRVNTTNAVTFASHTIAAPVFNQTVNFRQPQLADYDGDGAVDILVQGNPGAAIDPRQEVGANLVAVIFNDLQAAGSSATSNIGQYFSDRRIASGFASGGVPTINLAFDALEDYHLSLDINGDGLNDVLFIGPSPSPACVDSSISHSWWYQLNTGRRDQLFTTGQDTGSCLGLEATTPNALTNPVPTYSNMTRPIDWNQDGRSDLLIPRKLHQAICIIVADGAQGNEQKTYCPAHPDQIGWNPTINGCGTGNPSVEVCELYGAGKGSRDRSTYEMSVLEFELGSNGLYTVVERNHLETSLIGSPQTLSDDLFGDGINELYGVVGCTELPVTGGLVPTQRCTLPAGGYPLASELDNTLTGAGRGYFHSQLQSTIARQDVLDLMMGAVDGLGNEVSWSYEPLSANPVRTGTSLPLYQLPERNATCSIVDDSCDSLYDYQSEHYFYFRSSMYVVSQMQTSNGLRSGGNPLLNTTTYAYEEAVFNNQGRGFQGFRKITSEEQVNSGSAADNPANDLRSVSIFHQVFPLAGRLKESYTLPASAAANAGSTQAFSHTTNDWACRDDTAAPNAPGTLVSMCDVNNGSPPSGYRGVYQPVLASSFTLESDASGPYSITQVGGMDYDAYGNLLTRTTTTSDFVDTVNIPAPDVKTLRIETMTYDNNETTWWLGKLLTSETQSQIDYSGGFDDDFTAVLGDLEAQKITQQVVDWHPGLRKPTCQLTYEGSASATCTGAFPAGVQAARTETAYHLTTGNPLSVTVSASDLLDKDEQLTQRTTSTTYSSDGYFVNTITNALNHVTTTQVDPREGNPTQVIDANGKIVRMAYDAFGREIKTWFPDAGNITFDDVDLHYAPRSSTGYQSVATGICADSIMSAASKAYCIEQLTDGAPRQAQALDSLNRPLIAAVAGFGPDTSTRWVLTETAYNGRGQTVSTSAPHDATAAAYYTTYAYDILGRQIEKRQPRDFWVNGVGLQDELETYYRHHGLVTHIFVGDYGSSPPGNNCTVSVSGNTAPALGLTLCVKRSYSSGGQLLRTTDAAGKQTRFRHDGLGNPVAIIDVAGHLTHAQYNHFGQRTQLNDPNMGSWTFGYNGLGELLSQNDAEGTSTTFKYDDLGRMIERKAVSSSKSDVFDFWTYDTGLNSQVIRGLLAQERREAENPVGSMVEIYRRQYLYDTDLRPAGHTTTMDPEGIDNARTFTVTMGNDPYFGRPVSLTWPGNRMRLYSRYNKQGYVTHEGHSQHYGSGDELNQALRQVLAMSPTGQVERERYSNQNEQHFSYLSSTWQMATAGLDVPGSNGIVKPYDLSYQYDLFGNLSQQKNIWPVSNTTSWREERFGYDVLHRMTYSDRYQPGVTLPQNVEYEYDWTGNIMSKSDYAHSYQYAVNRVTSATLEGTNAVMSYHYDGNGNMTEVRDANSDPQRKVAYGPFNKPIKITATTAGGSTNLEFAYGSNQQRFFQLKNATEYIAYIDKMLEVYGVSNDPSSVINEKLYIGDYAVIDITDSTAETRFLHRDRLGSVVAVSTETGQVVNQSQRGFDPYGKPRENDWADSNGADENGAYGDLNRPDATTRGFTSHEHLNSVDLIHMNGRAYDYNLGRFLSVDPFVNDTANSQSLNPYSYISNNPMSGVDPTGYTATPPDATTSNSGPTGDPTGDRSTLRVKIRGVTGSRVRTVVSSATINHADGSQTNLTPIGSMFVSLFSGAGSYPTTNMGGGKDGTTESAGSPSQKVNTDALAENGQSGNFTYGGRRAGGPNRFSKREKEIILNEIKASVAGVANKGLVNAEDKDELAILLGERVLPISQKYNIEIGAIISEQENGSLGFEEPFTEFQSGEVTPNRRLCRSCGDAALFHTHPEPPGDNNFSRADIRGSIGTYRVDEYVAYARTNTDMGIKIFDYQSFQNALSNQLSTMQKINDRDSHILRFRNKVVGDKGHPFVKVIR